MTCVDAGGGGVVSTDIKQECKLVGTNSFYGFYVRDIDMDVRR